MRFSNIMSSEYTPFTYSEESGTHGSFIGGSPPANVMPYFISDHQKYFGTICFEEGFCISVFYSFEIFGDDDERDILSFNNSVLYPSELIHVVLHEPTARCITSPVPSEVTPHRIDFEGSISESGNEPFPMSKLGGIPYIDNIPLVGSAFEELEKSSFVQLIQFDTPNPITTSYIEGFPWDPGWLHLFVKGSKPEELQFAFIIQQ